MNASPKMFILTFEVKMNIFGLAFILYQVREFMRKIES